MSLRKPVPVRLSPRQHRLLGREAKRRSTSMDALLYGWASPHLERIEAEERDREERGEDDVDAEAA